MSNFNEPTNTSLYSGIWATVRALFAAIAKWDFTGVTNLPTGTKRWDSSTKKFQEWNGSLWVDLTVNFGDSIYLAKTPLANMTVDGATTGTAAGASFVVNTGGSPRQAVGNWSAIIGGAYDAAGLLWSANEWRFITNGGTNERMRLDLSNGYLLIGYTSSNGAYRLQVNSQIFATNATIATSDGRYKENVEELGGCLEFVGALRPVAFDWKRHPVHDFPDRRDVGFIAQEVKQALGDAEHAGSIAVENTTTLPDETQETFLELADAKLIPYLVGAIKELSAKNAALEARLAAVEAKVG